MDLADEADRPGPHRTDMLAARAVATTVANPARADAKVVVVPCHETTIGSRAKACKKRSAVIVPWRRKTCTSVGHPSTPRGDGARRLEIKQKTGSSAAPALRRLITQGRQNNVQTTI
jgi:hypothetical protein